MIGTYRYSGIEGKGKAFLAAYIGELLGEGGEKKPVFFL